MSDAVRDNSSLSRYELAFPGGTAFVTYRKSPGVVSLLHAEVPAQFAGRGIGAAVTRGALEAIRAAGQKVDPRCSFVAAFIRRHPEFHDLVAS
jgi:predicted GNAT family acetyltransferase